MQNKRVPVMGGARFIGSNLANRLTADNDVIAVDDTYLGAAKNLDDDVEFVEVSIVDGEPSVDVVFHLAALASRNIHESGPQRGCRVKSRSSLTPSSAPSRRAVTPSSTPLPP